MILSQGNETSGESPTLTVRNLSKRFGDALVLKNVDLDIGRGEVHGLLGHNGSGKSTLIKILAGFHEPEPGAEITLNGQTVRHPISAADFTRLGLAFVHQNLGLIPSLSVLENLLLSELSLKIQWKIDWAKERRKATELFQRFELKIDPDARLVDLSQTERAMVAIVRAFDGLSRSATGGKGLMILDEPTPFLPRAGVEQLFSLVRSIVANGSSVIFVSHDIDEITEITDRATILRDGVVAGTVNSKSAQHDDIVELILGKRVTLFQTDHRDLTDQPVRMGVRGLNGSTVRDVNLSLHKGEIIGLTGLIGSGFEEVPYLIFGANEAQSGEVWIDGARHALADTDPHEAIGRGLALLPSDRLARAGVGSLTVAENATIQILGRFKRNQRIHWPSVNRWVHEQGIKYEVRPNRPELKLQSLSGGNQQKVLLAKWLQLAPRVLMLDEPTQGVDVGARQRIYEAIHEATDSGMSVLCASTDAEQLAQICDRVLIFSKGKVVHELRGADVTKEIITEHCLRNAAAA